MKIQKIKNFGKKFFASIVLAVFTMGIFTPITHAVQLFGNDIGYDQNFNIPQIRSTEGVNYLSVNPNSSGLSSLVCYSGNDETCTHFIATITPLFLVDLEKFNQKSAERTYVTYRLGGLDFKVFADMPTGSLDENYIYFYYNSQLSGKQPLAKINRNEKCGTKNPNACIIAFHFYFYIGAFDGDMEMNLAHVDMIKYSNEKDELHYFKKEMSTSKRIGFLRTIKDFIFDVPGMGEPIGKMRDYYTLFNINDSGYRIFVKEQILGKKYYSAFKKDNFGIMSNDFYSYYSRGQYASIIGISSMEGFNGLQNENITIRDFLIGNENTKLTGTLPDYFGAKGAIYGIVNNNTNQVETDPNVYNSTDFNRNCGITEIGCYIKNMTVSIGKFIGNIWNGFVDIIKNIFSWVWESGKNFFLGFLKTEFYKNWIQPIYDYFSSFVKVIFNLFTGKYDFDTLKWGNQEYFCSKNPQYFIIENTTNQGDKPIETLGSIWYLINPFPPKEGTQICTSLGLKTIKYGPSTIMDLILFNIFVFAGIWFIFLFLRKYN